MTSVSEQPCAPAGRSVRVTSLPHRGELCSHGPAARAPCASLRLGTSLALCLRAPYRIIHRPRDFRSKARAWVKEFLGAAPRPEAIEEALAIADCFPPSKRLVASSPTAERRTMANDHMALWRADTMGLGGAMPPPLSGEEDMRSSHRKTGRPILSLTSNCLDARAYLFS
jgi:hypothetical protein